MNTKRCCLRRVDLENYIAALYFAMLKVEGYERCV